MALVMIAVTGVVLVKAFVSVWMYNWAPDPAAFPVPHPRRGGRAVDQPVDLDRRGRAGAFLTMLTGYVVEKKKPFFAQPLYLLSVIPAAIPGMVMGLGYILIYNTRFLRLDHLLYGKAALIIINTVVCNFTLGTLSSISNMKNIDNSMDEAATSLGGHRAGLRAGHPAPEPGFVHEQPDLLLHAQHGDHQRGGLPDLPGRASGRGFGGESGEGRQGRLLLGDGRAHHPERRGGAGPVRAVLPAEEEALPESAAGRALTRLILT